MQTSPRRERTPTSSASACARVTPRRAPGLPPKQGLYDPFFEHEACGVGFVVDMKGRRSHEIVRLIVMLAHSVGLKVVAEGTETEDQITELKRLNCEMAQGFLYSPPVDRKAAFGLLLRSHEPVLAS